MPDTNPHRAAHGPAGALTTDSPDFASAAAAIRPLLDEFGRLLGDASPTMAGTPKVTPCADPSDPNGPWQVTVQDYWATAPDARLLSGAPAAAAEVFAGWQSDNQLKPGSERQSDIGRQAAVGPNSEPGLRFRRSDGLLAATVKAGSDANRGWVTVSLSTPCATGPEPHPAGI
ncbi:hypothetical protein GCM10022261_07560 [Brevibacterium daeguense]|uniref:Uncharacterized protein n=1 Tax=Brevibacterium daeguense TaxID=909936 RepID=A0ABP8EH03_9MICO|nr:hypothetical protein [Brevibacterium daeguense]